MPMSASELDGWFKDAARDKLQDLSVFMNITKTITYDIDDWSHGVNTHSASGSWVTDYDGTTWWHPYWDTHPRTPIGYPIVTSVASAPFDMSSATSAIFNDDLDVGIGSGLIADADDVAASIANAVASTVTAIETALSSYSSNVLVCHGSCHTSCHNSRGRR